MENPEDSQVAKTFSRFAGVGAVSVAVIGVTVLIGWIFGIQFLKTVFPGLVSMKFNTALSFLAAGVALRISYRDSMSNTARLIGTALGIFVFVVAGLTLLQYAFGLNFGIDQLIIHDDFNSIHTSNPGRMAPVTALAFIVTGLSLIMLSNRIYGSHWFATIGFILGLTSTLGYIFGAKSLYGFGPYTSMAIHTAVSFMIVNLSALFSRPKMGFMDTISSDSLGGIAARKLLILIPAAVICLGMLCRLGANLGWYDANFSLSLMALSGILISSLFLILVSTELKRSDKNRQLAQMEISELNLGLEARIKARTDELQQALDNVKRLEGFLPMCAWCKKIRDDKNYWSSVEVYISERTDAQISHGMCPDCFAKKTSEIETAGKEIILIGEKDD